MNGPLGEETIFAEALRLSPDERVAYLDQSTDGDAALRQRVESLLKSYGAGDFMERAAAPQLRQTLQVAIPVTEKPGDTIGRYKLLQQIGEGGCGIVYMAEQSEPVRRRVALKVIKLGMDTKSVIARFEAERQALALMDHPNIAKVLDAGATEAGRPYFVMELVRGMKITEYCDEARLSTRARLDLFIKVCQAIQHAHQKGIIHRDIKPSNILVTVNDGVPVPKVIDFGIAKATGGQQLTDKTLFTAFEQFIGTPAYMSPEQAVLTSVDIDTRSDIYALGVLLYELLTGRTPFDAQALLAIGFDEMRRTIREQEPPRPSTRLSTLPGQELSTTAQRRGLNAPKLVSELRGDLDWIVMKALEKDRARRYETASGLASDIQRHLRSEPVLAHSPSATYRMQKFVRRNGAMVTSGVIIATVLVGGAGVSTWQAVRATRAQREQARLRHQAEGDEQKARLAQRREAEQRRAAEVAQRNETGLRRQAEARAYASDINLTQQAMAMHNIGRAQDLLNRHRPARILAASNTLPTDLRGWEWRYLWQQSRSDALYTFCQRSNRVAALAMSNDGKWLAVGEEEEGGLTIWDIHTGQQAAFLRAGESRTMLAFSPSAPLFAYSCRIGGPVAPENYIQLWDAATHQMVGKLPLNSDCRGLQFTSDGQRLITSSGGRFEGRITIWQIPSGKELARHPAFQFGDPAPTFAATPDGRFAAHQMQDPRMIRLINLETGQECWTAPGAEEGQRISAFAFSPDGKILASGACFLESDIRLWDVASGQEVGRLRGHAGWISSLLFLPDSKTLVSAGGDQRICLWDTTSLHQLRSLRGHRSEVLSLALVTGGTTLFSGCKDGSVCAWDTGQSTRQTGEITIPAVLHAWRFTADGNSVLAIDRQGRVLRWSGEEFQTQQTLLELNPNSPGAWILPDAQTLVVGSTNGAMEVWNLSTRTLIGRLPPGAAPSNNWQHASVRTLSQSPRLVMGYWGIQKIREWDLNTWQESPAWPRPTGMRAGSFSADGRSCLTFDWSGASQLREIETGREIDPHLDIRHPVGAAFSPDGKLFAAASLFGYARLWDVATFREVATFGGFLLGVESVAFSPDSRRLATGSAGKEAVKVWDLESRQELLTMAGGSGIGSLAFSPDGNVLGAMNLIEGVLHLWRAPPWAEIKVAEEIRRSGEQNSQPSIEIK